MLHARSLHSPYAHAKVTKLDWTKALAMPGVRGAIDRLGKNRLVRYAGQEIMSLAADDEATARRAIEEVEIEFDVRKALVDPAAAKKAGAAQIYARSSERRHPVSAAEGPVVPAGWEGNRRGPFKAFSKNAGRAKRAVERAKKGEGLHVGGSFTAAVQCHTCLEPHAAVADWKKDSLTVYVSTQAVSHLQHEISEHFDLPEENVRVIAEYVGRWVWVESCAGYRSDDPDRAFSSLRRPRPVRPRSSRRHHDRRQTDREPRPTSRLPWATAASSRDSAPRSSRTLASR